MNAHDLFQKYMNYFETLDRSDDELAFDFDMASRIIDRAPNDGQSVALTTVRDWIAQERRLRIPGLGRELPN